MGRNQAVHSRVDVARRSHRPVVGAARVSTACRLVASGIAAALTGKSPRQRAVGATIATTLVAGALASLVFAPPASATNLYQYLPQNGDSTGTCSAAGTYVVPAGVTLLDITAYGQSGSRGLPGDYAFGPGGIGGKVVARVPVTPGQTLWVAPNSLAVAGGNNNNWGSGGNGSLVSTVDPAAYCGAGHPAMPVSDVLVIAAGGGGGANGTYGPGGSGGAAGQAGSSGGDNTAADGGGGAAGTQSGGGAGGARGTSPDEYWGDAGADGQYLTGGGGGAEGHAPDVSGAGGGAGGGGGFFGGGGGGGGALFSADGGGGGGSNYVTPSAPSTYPADTQDPGVLFNGSQEYSPEIDIVPVYTSTTSLITSSLNPAALGARVDLSVTVHLSDGTVPEEGTVTFFDGATVIGTSTVNTSTGFAQVSVTSLTQGVHLIQARFDGADRLDQHDAISWAPNPNGGSTPYQQQITAAPLPPAAPVVTENPADETKSYSVAGAFSAAAHGVPAPTVQWQKSSDGGHTFTDIPGATSTQLDTFNTVPGSVTSDVLVAHDVDQSGNQYRAVFTNASGSATTSAATMTVLQEPLTIVANDTSMFPGSAVPPLTASYPNLTHQSVADAVTTAPTCTTTATSSSPAGTYPITCSGADTPNYIPTYQDGTLTVDPASERTSFDVPDAASGWFAGDWITLSAVGGVSGNPVDFAIDPATPAGLCSLDGSTLMLAAALEQAGDCLVTATQPGTSTSIAPPVTRDVRVNVPPRAAILMAPDTGVATASDDVLTAIGYDVSVGGSAEPTSLIAITGAPSNNGVCSVSTVDAVTTVHYLAVGACIVHAQQPQGPFRAAGTTQVITVGPPLAQTITFALPTSPWVGAPPTTLTAAGGGSTSPVEFSSDTPTVCSVDGTSLTFIAEGTCTITANQAAGPGYAAATPVQHSVTVGPPLAQTITFSLPTSPRAGDLPTTLTAIGGGSTSPVTFSSGTPTVCSVDGTSLTFTAEGTCTITANQAAGPGYAAAAPTAHSVTVLPGIVFDPPATGAAGQSVTLTATKVLEGRTPVTYALAASSGAGVCSLSGTNNALVTYLAVGSCVVTASQASIPGFFIGPPDVTRTITVIPGTQTVAFTSTPPTDAVVGGSYTPTFTRTTTSSSPAALATTSPATVCTVDPISNLVSFTGTGTCTLTLNQAANSSYSAAPQVTQDVVVTAPLAITSDDHASFAAGDAGTFDVTTAGGFPDQPALSLSGTLPSGVSFSDNGDGTATFSGTPAADAGGSYPLTVTASNAVAPDATQSFTLTVTELPAISSPDAATLVAGSSGSFTVTTVAGFPTATALSESGPLPSGVSFIDNGDGTATLTGTPAAGSGAAYPLTITATNSAGHTDQAFTLSVAASPTISSANHTTFAVSSAGSFDVSTAGGFPERPALSVSGSLPTGVTFHDNGDGTATISGTPAVSTGGSYAITITANNGDAAVATQTFTLTVDEFASITSADHTNFSPGVSGSFTVTTAPGYPLATTLTESGALPSGVTFADNGDGTATLAGTPASGMVGSYPLTIHATNGGGSRAQSFTLTVTARSQTITFATIADRLVGATPFTVSASTSSGLPVTLTSATTPVCTVSGRTVTLITAGACTLTATQPGNTDWLAAAPVSRTFLGGYAVSGLAAPNKTQFTPGSTIPVKFQLTGANGKPIANSVASSLGCNVTVSFNGGAGICAAYNSKSQQFQANIATPTKLTHGATYPIVVTVTVGTTTVASAQTTVTAK